MALFFKERRRLVLGRETAEDAVDRLEDTVEKLLHDEPEGNVAAVTHGTVLALFCEGHGLGDGFQLWRKMGLPSAAVFSVPDLKALELVERIA